jgi:transcriptional regulator with XRE-family HTH domain
LTPAAFNVKIFSKKGNNMNLGTKIKELRKSKEMTLKQLSDRSRVALTTLSRIENEKMRGTVDSHMRISAALGVGLTELYRELEEKGKTASIDLQSKKKKADIFTHNKYAAYEILTKDFMKKKMMPVLLRIAPGGSTNKQQHQFGTDKFVYVVDGKVQADIGSSKYVLGKGDALYFDGSLPHYWKNLGKKQALCVCVIDPPTL